MLIQLWCKDAFPTKLASDLFKGYKRRVANLVLNGEMSSGRREDVFVIQRLRRTPEAGVA